ncbi:hypothetical protein GGQ84_000989 [Desulfitispora alkaliphila]
MIYKHYRRIRRNVKRNMDSSVFNQAIVIGLAFLFTASLVYVVLMRLY